MAKEAANIRRGSEKRKKNPPDFQRISNTEHGTKNPEKASPAPTATKSTPKKQGDDTEELKKKFLKDKAAALQPSQVNGGEADG